MLRVAQKAGPHQVGQKTENVMVGQKRKQAKVLVRHGALQTVGKHLAGQHLFHDGFAVILKNAARARGSAGAQRYMIAPFVGLEILRFGRGEQIGGLDKANALVQRTASRWKPQP